jgi:hypothetical protein
MWRGHTVRVLPATETDSEREEGAALLFALRLGQDLPVFKIPVSRDRYIPA